jgi:hypothetical protein
MQTAQSGFSSAVYAKETLGCDKTASAGKSVFDTEAKSFNEVFEETTSIPVAANIHMIYDSIIKAHYEEQGRIKSIKDGVKTSEDYHVSADYELRPTWCIEGCGNGLTKVSVAYFNDALQTMAPIEPIEIFTYKNDDPVGRAMTAAFMASLGDIAINRSSSQAEISASISLVREECISEQNKQLTESIKKSSSDNMTAGLKGILQKAQLESLFGLSEVGA